MPEEHGVQQQPQRNTQNQHLHHQVALHPGQTSFLQGYGTRNRGGGGGKVVQGNASSGNIHVNDNPYRKEVMDYYMSVSGKERTRRGSQALEYGAGFGYSNVGGQVPHQYRHAGNAPDTSVLSDYQLDYTATAGGNGGTTSSGKSSTSAFSPSHQYGLSQNSSLQSRSGQQIHAHQQSHDYPPRQSFPQRQQHRVYPLSGHRQLPTFSQYPLANASTGSSGIYHFSPQRYHSGGNTGNFECEISSSANASSKPGSDHSSVKSSNVAQLDTGRLSYSSSNYQSYNFHGSQPFPKQSVYPPRYSQHNLRPDYDLSNKMQATSLPAPPSTSYSKHSQPSISSSDSLNTLPQFSSQEIPKGVMQPQSQQQPVNQNFSPISNPSPVASGVQSPNCSSSPSPLMGVSEGSGNSTVPSNQLSSHTSLSEHQNSHSQQLQLVHQLSPTPNSNSSISSFEGSVGNGNTAGINTNPGGNHSALTKSQMGSVRMCDKNFSSLYPSSVDKLNRDTGINSLSALTSQVANLPNTVQHTLVSDPLLTKRGVKDSTYEPDDHYQTLQTSHGLAVSQQKIEGTSNGCNNNTAMVSTVDGTSGQSDSGMNETIKGVKQEGDEQPLGGSGDRSRHMSEASSESDSTGYHIPSKNKVKETGNGFQSLPLELKVASSKSQNLACSRRTEHHNVSVSPSSSPSSLPPSVEPVRSIPSSQTAAFTSTSISNCTAIISPFQSSKELCGTNINDRNKVKEKDAVYDRKNRKAVDKHTEGMLEGSKCDLPAREHEKFETPENQMDVVLLNTSPYLNKKREVCENGAKPQNSEISSENVRSGETHNVGVGVIVSTRSEVPQPSILSETSKDTSSALHLFDNEQKNSQMNPKKTHVSNMFKDSGCLNGQSEASPCDFASINGNTFTSKPSYEQALLLHPHSDNQKSSYGYSDLPEDSGMNLKKTQSQDLNTGDESRSQYQSQHQPQSSYMPKHRKTIGSGGIMKPSRKGRERGHDNQSQIQQSSPSLLQEVLQGYHVDKTYEHSKNLQLPETQSQSIGHHTARRSYGVTESTKHQSLVSKTEESGNHQACIQVAAIAKDYPINLKMGNTTILGQDPSSHPWAAVGVGRAPREPSQKVKIETSSSSSTSNLQESNDLSQQPRPKSMNFSVYTSPHRKPVPNHPAMSSAVQQLLLEDIKPKLGSELFVNQTQPQASSVLPSSISSSERCSVICDVSVRTASEKEKDRDKDNEQGNCKQTGSTGASVIQQSHSVPLTNLEDNSKENQRAVQIKIEGCTPKKVISQSDTCGFFPRHFPEKKHAVHLQHRPAYQSGNANSDAHILSPVETRDVNLASINPYHTQPISSNLTPQSSPLSRCQLSFPGIDGSDGHSGYGFENLGEGRPFHPHGPSQQHPHLPTKFQLGNSQGTNKLQMYPHSQSVQYSHDVGDKQEWTALNKNKHPKDIMASSTRSSGHQYQNPLGMRSQTSHTDTVMQPKLGQQFFSQQGNYYNMKLWSLSESGKDAGRAFQSNTYQTSQSSVIPPGSGPSRRVTEKVIKPFQPVSAQFSSSSNISCAGGMANLGTLQGHRQVKTERPGDANPLMMRRRVRSFISPIPAKRQHQDTSQQQQQRNASSLCPSTLHNTASRQPDANSLSPDVLSSKSVVPDSNYSKISQNTTSNSPSPSEGKTKILPPRKGRGLKLEAIVQKITPNVKKEISNRSHVDSVPDPLSSTSHADVIHYNLDNQERESLVGGNLSKTPAEHGSSNPFLDEGLSLEEIMSYKGVEEIGPLAPTAYPCDIDQNPMTIKCGTSENGSRNVIDDLKQEVHYGMEAEAPQFTDRDCAGGNKEELRLSSDFTLLGPLPPPPPLPRPVEASPPPSSSVLSDIQHFTNTYQQLETRRGEDSAENFMRKKMTDAGIGLGSDDYASRDFYGADSFHHNQSSRHCLLTRLPNNHQIHQQHHFSQTLSSVANVSQLTELKPLDNVVPKGYFPSGKKKGRPVGSVNKQKRAQVQTLNVCVSVSPVITTQTAAPTVATEIILSTAAANQISATHPLTDNKPSSEVSSDASQIMNIDAEKVDVEPKAETEQCNPDEENFKEDESGETKLENKQRKRRRRVSALMGKDVLQAADSKSASGVFLDHRKSIFAPYVHVERKTEEIGAVCTIVNEEEERKGGKSDTPLNSTVSFELTMKERNTETVKEKSKIEQATSSLLTICTAGKTVPLSGYVLSGPVITESSHSGHLLCCLCKKWANYKNLGDLYGPYYPPEYVTSLPKSNPQIRHNLGNTKMASKGLDLGTDVVETSKDVQLTEVQAAESTIHTECAVNEIMDIESLAVTTDKMPAVDAGKLQNVWDKIGDFYNDSKLVQELTSMGTVLNQHGPVQPQEQLLTQQHLAEDVQLRPQHRKLTSHPRFKKRHRPGEDLPKSTPSNFKTSLPFQPPPQIHNYNPSETLALLTQLPHVPVDPKELWVHEGCIAWASGVFLVNGRLYGLQEALDGAMDTSCSYCEQVGSTLGCYSKGCTLRYHYLCAIEADCSLNEENFSLRCSKHKFSQKSGADKAVHLEQSERG